MPDWQNEMNWHDRKHLGNGNDESERGKDGKIFEVGGLTVCDVWRRYTRRHCTI